MDVRRRSTMDTPAPKAKSGPMKVKVVDHENNVVVVEAKASDALPLLLYLTNVVFFTLFFFFVVYFLLTRWREKIRTSTPLHVVDLSKIVAIVAFVASFIYLLGFNKPSSRGGFFRRRSKFSLVVGCVVVGPPLKCCRVTRPEAYVKATRLIKQKSSPVLGLVEIGLA